MPDLCNMQMKFDQNLLFSPICSLNFVRTSEVRKMKEKMRKCYVTEKMESQQEKVTGYSTILETECVGGSTA